MLSILYCEGNSVHIICCDYVGFHLKYQIVHIRLVYNLLARFVMLRERSPDTNICKKNLSISMNPFSRIGGTVGATLTCPLEVVKTRLQVGYETFVSEKQFSVQRDWLCTVHEEVCMLCSRVHEMHAFGHAYADGFPYNMTYLFCSASVFGHLK